jgi:transcriptional regulator with XRE-family HTH domain
MFINLERVKEKTGLSRSMLSYVFHGKRSPSLESAEKLAKALGMTVGNLIETLKADNVRREEEKRKRA